MEKPWDEKTKKEKVFGLIDDLFMNWLYYDRKECEDFDPGDIEDLVSKGEITKQEIIDRFMKNINVNF
jgi:hypothetical protein